MIAISKFFLAVQSISLCLVAFGKNISNYKVFILLSQFAAMDKVFETNAIFKELSASINKVFILGGSLGTRL